MRITKKINNNVALAQDDSGKEMVIFGKGVGFPKTPYLLTDESVVRKRFYGIDERLLKMVVSLSDDVLIASSEIVDLAKEELGCSLNPNLVFTLADHLQFAISRTQRGIVLENPLASDIGAVYPRETSIGYRGIELTRRVCAVELPLAEAFAIAMHIVNGELQNAGSLGDMSLVMESTHMVDAIIKIVEAALGFRVDRFSYPYMSLVTHLRYLIGRLMKSSETAGAADNSELIRQLGHDFPEAYTCAIKIGDYLLETHGWRCSNEEVLYLMMHINRFVTQR